MFVGFRMTLLLALAVYLIAFFAFVKLRRAAISHERQLRGVVDVPAER